jgi:peptidoglycan/xylan/chitin deacetylase (PgdA/CDA1 family)
VTPPELSVFIGAPEAFAPRAEWVLGTLLAPLGRRAAVTRDPARASGAALAYAADPVPGVPTVPCDTGAMGLFAATRSLPAGAFAVRGSGDGSAVAAWPADPGAGFAVPFDLVSSAFVLLACWDERTNAERDKYDRLPLSASVFATNAALRIDEPAVDRYAEVLRGVLAPRLEELGLEPLPAPGWLWGEGAGFAVALTHDVDNLWRWTRRGVAAASYRTLRAARRLDTAAVRRELGDGADWLVRHLPRRTDPFWTFPQILDGEDARGVSSTFFVIARHTHRQDGNQPQTYRRRVPEALSLLARHRREIGLHGNDADRLGIDPLLDDRGLLARRAHSEIHGIRYHYLRCLYHETLPLVEQARFSYDSSLAFAEHEGFRCGCSFPFSPYYLREERPLDLVELPLAVMDGTLQQPHYRGLPAAAAEAAAASVLARALRSGGAVSLLWHNNRFDKRVSRGYDKVYWRLVEQLLEHGALLTSAGELVARWRRRFGMPEPSSPRAAGAPTCATRLDSTALSARTSS